jgi:hypothetical protein
MTTIAWDGKVVAADSRLTGPWYDDRRGLGIKLVKIGGGGPNANCIACFSGRGALAIKLARLLAEGTAVRDLPIVKEDECDLFVFRPNGEHLEVSRGGDPYPLKGYAPAALGSGQAFAMGAMLAGASAIEAVAIAIRLDEGSGGNIVAYSTESMLEVGTDLRP